jgi:glutamate-ammonia-ligase adenylyltransferase
MLERQRGSRRGEVDIKYGAGGLLDIYFATRYLQLRDSIPDQDEDRSTRFVLGRLLENGSITPSDHEIFSAGHTFLSELDHNIRLVTGRSRQLPREARSLKIITERSGFSDTADLLEVLALQRLNIRTTFERVVGG